MGVAAFRTLDLVYYESADTLGEVSVRLEASGLLRSHFRNNSQPGVDKRLCDVSREHWLWRQGDTDSSLLLKPPSRSFFLPFLSFLLASLAPSPLPGCTTIPGRG